MVRDAAAAKAANGVAQAKPRLKAMLAATSNAIQMGRRQPMLIAYDWGCIGVLLIQLDPIFKSMG